MPNLVRQPAVQKFGSAVMLQGTALLEARSLLLLGARVRERRDAIVLSPQMRHLLVLISEAVGEDAMSPQRRGDVASGPDPAESEFLLAGSFQDSAAAATVLGVSRRQTQRLAAAGLGRKVGRTWLLDRESVELYAAERYARENSG